MKHLSELKNKSTEDLVEVASKAGIEDPAAMKRQEIMFAIVKAIPEDERDVKAEGVLEVLQDGFGFLRSPDSNYFPVQEDIYVSPSQIRRYGLRTGDTITGSIRPPNPGERYFALLKLESINYENLSLIHI